MTFNDYWTEPGREAIEALRAKVPQRSTPVSVTQAKKIVDLLEGGFHSLEQISDAAGLARVHAITTIVDLGTWLGQSINAGADCKVFTMDDAPYADVAQPSLFKGHSDDFVILPWGFERSAAGRDLSKAVAQIVRAKPDEAMMRRWLMRRYHRIRQVLGFETVALIHRLCQIGRLGEVDQLPSRGEFNFDLARILVEAYDLLDVARGDAVSSIEALMTHADEVLDRNMAPNLALIETNLVNGGWLSEATLGRLLAALKENSERAVVVLSQFRRSVNASPVTYRPQAVAALTDGQVRRLAEREGLRLEGASYQEAETIRSWVSDAGMGSDADLLVADGIRAFRAGLGQLFQDALTRRAEGDLTWADELNDALEGVARV